jgi:hypothetical protein
MKKFLRFWLPQFTLSFFLSATAFKDTTTDWVNPRYVLQKGVQDPSTAPARQWMVRQADATAQNGPWSKAWKSFYFPFRSTLLTRQQSPLLLSQPRVTMFMTI